jgi:CubicO group peptidase (beta-lactamase class C family)
MARRRRPGEDAADADLPRQLDQFVHRAGGVAARRASKLDLDAPVQQTLPWFRVADETASAQITVRHLLNQTSGLSASGDPAPGDYAESLESEVRDLAEVRPTSPVGSRFRYYNQNYRVVGLLIEQASGQPYAQYLAEHITQPLGMAHTVTDPASAPDLALGYGQHSGSPSRAGKPICQRPAVGLCHLNRRDMAQYLLAMLNQAAPAISNCSNPRPLPCSTPRPPTSGAATVWAGCRLGRSARIGAFRRRR